MGNKNSSNGINDKVKEFLATIVVAIIVIYIILYLIYKFITEILIPILIGLFLIALALILTILLVRVLAHLFSYLTLEKRCGRKISDLSEKVSQLDAYISAAGQRIPDLSARQRSAAEAELRERDITLEALKIKRRNIATALADHLADKLDGVNRSRNKILRKIDRHESDKLKQKLEKKDEKVSILEAEIERLKIEYYIEPDPAFERKERKYPIISGFDRLVSSLFNRERDQ